MPPTPDQLVAANDATYEAWNAHDPDAVAAAPGAVAKLTLRLFTLTFTAYASGLEVLVGESTGEQTWSHDGKPLKPSLSPKEVAQALKSAVQQGHYYARNPQAREKARASALSVAPRWAAGLKAGVRHPVDVEAWVMMQEVSGLLSPEEAAEFRRDAGLA